MFKKHFFTTAIYNIRVIMFFLLKYSIILH